MVKQKREKRFSMVFYDYEYEELEKYSQKCRTTKSDFIRQAIIGKIQKYDSPEAYNGIVKTVKNGQTKAEAKQEARTIDLKKELARQFIKVSQDMKNLKEISNMKRKVITQGDLNLVMKELGQKEANIKELQKSTDIDYQTIRNILQDTTLFTINMNGKYKLKGIHKLKGGPRGK